MRAMHMGTRPNRVEPSRPTHLLPAHEANSIHQSKNCTYPQEYFKGGLWTT
jgi:hypothetical protein